MPLVNMTVRQLVARFSQDEFLKEHLVNYRAMTSKTKQLAVQWIAQHTEEITKYEGYEDIYHSFRRSMTVPVSLTWILYNYCK